MKLSYNRLNLNRIDRASTVPAMTFKSYFYFVQLQPVPLADLRRVLERFHNYGINNDIPYLVTIINVYFVLKWVGT